ncbi:hypothetical protein A7K94_0218290, partial [Modestobacter sp. VKM Ac-2676]
MAPSGPAGRLTVAAVPGRGPCGAEVGGHQQLGQAEVVVPEAEHADHLAAAPLLRQPGVQPGLDVDVLVPGPGLLGDLAAVARAEVPGQQRAEGDLVVDPGRLGDRTHAAPGELAQVGELERAPVGRRRCDRVAHRR